MRGVIVAVILILGLLLIPSVASAASGVQVVSKTGDGNWTDDTWQVEIYPGETKSTNLTLYNPSSSSLAVEVNVTPNSQDNGNLVFELNKSNFTMTGKSYDNVTLTVKANGSTTPGTYTAELEIAEGPAPPSVTTAGVRAVAWGTAVLWGTLDDLGTASPVYVSFEWGTSDSYGNETTTRAMTSTEPFTIPLTGLSPSTTYHFRAKAVGDGTGYGSDSSFTTTARRVGGGVGGGGGGGGGAYYLDIDILGKITRVRISYATSRTLESVVVPDFNNTNFLEIDYGTTVICPELGEAPEALMMRVANESPPVPDGSALIGSAYNFTGNYGYNMLKYCSGVTFGKNITIVLDYDPDELPESTVSLAVAYYDIEQGSWVNLPTDIGRVAEIGKATGVMNHFSTVAVIAELASPSSPASFVGSALNIEQSQKVWKSTFVAITGNAVTITANVANNGGQEGTYIAELKLNGETVDAKEVTLAAGQSQQVSFTLYGMDYGQYEVEVAGLSGEFTVSQSIDWLSIFGIIVAIGLITWAAIWGRRRWKKAAQPAQSE